MVQGNVFEATAADFVAFFWFFACWAGYTYFADHRPGLRPSLISASHDIRLRWMERMLGRENRMPDIFILSNFNRTISMFATTTVFILAGLVTVLGALDTARDVTSALFFMVKASRVMWEIKVLMLILIFIFAFFTFVWAIRQMNFGLSLIGSAPFHDDPGAPDRPGFAERCARLVTRGANSFNRGLRAYYFGLAVLAWFVHPWVFAFASVWVVLVLYRREFRSVTVRMLSAPGGGNPDRG